MAQRRITRRSGTTFGVHSRPVQRISALTGALMTACLLCSGPAGAVANATAQPQPQKAQPQHAMKTVVRGGDEGSNGRGATGATGAAASNLDIATVFHGSTELSSAVNASGVAYLQDSRTTGTPWMPLSLVSDYPSGGIVDSTVAVDGDSLYVRLMTTAGTAYETVCSVDPPSLTSANLNSRCSAFTAVTAIP